MGRIKRLAVVTAISASALGVTAAPAVMAFSAAPAPVPVASVTDDGMYHHG